jgi:hypothetical protein
MTEAHLIQEERAALATLARLAKERGQAEQEVARAYGGRNQTAEQKFKLGLQRVTEAFHAQHEALQVEYDRVRQSIVVRHDAEHNIIDRQLAEAKRQLEKAFADFEEEAEARISESRWTITTLYEADRAKTENRLHEFGVKLAAMREHIDSLGKDTNQFLSGWIPLEHLPADFPPHPAVAPSDLLARVEEEIERAGGLLAKARSLPLLAVLPLPRFLGLLLVIWLASLASLALTPSWVFWVVGASLGVPIIGGALYFALLHHARSRLRALAGPEREALALASALARTCQEQVASASSRQLARAQERHAQELAAAEERHQRHMGERRAQRDRELANAEENYRARLGEALVVREGESRKAEEKYPALLTGARTRFESESYQIHDAYYRELADSKAIFDDDFATLSRNWQQGLAEVQATLAEVNRQTSQLFLPWNSPRWNNWTAPTAIPPVIRFGELTVNMAQIPDGIPTDEQLKVGVPSRFALPALIAFPDSSSLVIQTNQTGQLPAELAMQGLLFRLLTTVPPGKVRFTIIDPVGLGRPFAAFMHLADFDEALVTSRIWTESHHIDQRLADLTLHMETVIQKYLRNQYQTIQEYNSQAGEVAEPFRVVVVANFPANFSAEAARRLLSIAASGPRCGVYTLVTVDSGYPFPQGFVLADLLRHATCLVWKDGRFLWQDPDFGAFPLAVDPPPPAEIVTSALQVVGKEAKESSRVEVPFEFIAPVEDQWWLGDSRPGIRVPLGRAGATKRQLLQLGHGTAQHVLIAGKTGSGKSTLLHALITNLALLYSPEEVELFLVDFKEGVEFKPYATYELPHARLVAIESEREFGLSVLKRLEAELKDRGDRFRERGVQDISGFRSANGTSALPRILLIVDEFQLFFVEDDKIAQEAALLLDRLVRQGRAFGIHVLLGSQTLGGAYSLARSTIGQMAVRIALQCSEADAHLILNDDNTAARMLSRPGEAIYNDANGLVEGNDFFQVVWLSDERREDYLRRISALAQSRHFHPAQPQIVFEGNAPADIRKNQLLRTALEGPEPQASPRAMSAWLGEAMAIKDPTAAVFHAQGGSNLLMVGQADEAVLAIFTTALISLAAQLPANGGESGGPFYVLDGSPSDGLHAGFLASLVDIVPRPIQVGGWREVANVIGEVALEVERRTTSVEAGAPPWFLFIYGLQRFRDLRQQEDDFGFGRRGEDQPPSPAKLFTTILKEGPAVGVHTLVWADSLTSATRALDRSALREFEMKVLFQMSPADSSTLIDSPLASKLGLYRALFYSEDRGQPEKFRPYGLPGAEWLAWVKEQFTKGRQASGVV